MCHRASFSKIPVGVSAATRRECSGLKKTTKGADDFEAASMTEPSIDYRRLSELTDEFMALWERLQAFYLDSAAGFHFITERLNGEPQKRHRADDLAHFAFKRELGRPYFRRCVVGIDTLTRGLQDA
jgi:hypothetical protein